MSASPTEDDVDRDYAEALACWDAIDPPAGFVARVALAARTRARRRGWSLAAVAVVVTVTALFLAARPIPVANSGELHPERRTTVVLGTRGVAVADAGAEIAWSVQRDGRARIEQRVGTVFYRVEPGGPFEVATPAGAVSAVGTSFEVEVKQRLGSTLIAAGIGASVATAITVTVYEGSVVLANDAGSAEISAGERSTATLESEPSVPRDRTRPEAAPVAEFLAQRPIEVARRPDPPESPRTDVVAPESKTTSAVGADARGEDDGDSPASEKGREREAWRRAADEALDALVEETNLDASTRAAMFDLLEHQREEIDTLVDAGERGEVPWSAVNQDIQGVVSDYHEQFRGMLTDEQFELYRSIRAEQYGGAPEDVAK